MTLSEACRPYVLAINGGMNANGQIMVQGWPSHRYLDALVVLYGHEKTHSELNKQFSRPEKEPSPMMLKHTARVYMTLEDGTATDAYFEIDVYAHNQAEATELMDLAFPNSAGIRIRLG